MGKLIDAVHILCDESIPLQKLNEAENLLSLFTKEHEAIFGKSSMVFNVHLLTHLCDGVRYIGPLHCYSNYCFEDNIGHLVDFQKGTTDVSKQISQRYLLEKGLLQYIQKSPLAREFYDEIRNKSNLTIIEKVETSLLAGKLKSGSNLTSQETTMIRAHLEIPNDEQIREYKCVLLHGKLFYENNMRTSCKRTNDSFIFDVNSKNFAEIKSIFVYGNKLFFLIAEKYEVKRNSIVLCNSIIHLQKMKSAELKIIQEASIGPKHVLIKCDDEAMCSRFPNLFEKN